MTKDAARGQRELLAVISTGSPGDMASAAYAWRKASIIASEALAHTQARLNALCCEGGWTGPGADAYKTRITAEVLKPLQHFVQEATEFHEALTDVALAFSQSVVTAQSSPIPWDESTRWRVEQQPVERSVFSHLDEFLTGEDEAYEEAKSNAPYEIKSGGGTVVKEVSKPAWQATVSAVGIPPVPPIYAQTGASVGVLTVRFDALMEFQAMNTAQRASLRRSAESVNAVLGKALPDAGKFSQTKTKQSTELSVDADDRLSQTSSDTSDSASPASTATDSSSTPSLGGSGSSGSGTGSAGLSSGGTSSGSGSSSSMGSSASPTALTSGSTGSVLPGGASRSSWTSRDSDDAAVDELTGTSAAGMGGATPTLAGSGAGGLGAGSLSGGLAGSGLGKGGLGAGGGMAGFGGGGGFSGMSGGAGGGFSGGNASFSMGTHGRGMISLGNVGPVANAQVPLNASTSGIGAMPMRGGARPQDDKEAAPDDDMFLDEDRDVWADDVTAPPGTID